MRREELKGCEGMDRKSGMGGWWEGRDGEGGMEMMRLEGSDEANSVITLVSSDAFVLIIS